MSKYRKMQTRFSSRFRLREALKASGIPFEECKPGQEKHLYGYHGDVRPETATFIVRREHIGMASNDLGWTWNGKEYEEIVSEYDSTYRGCTRIRRAVKREYTVSETIHQAHVRGYAAERINQTDGSVQVVITGRL